MHTQNKTEEKSAPHLILGKKKRGETQLFFSKSAWILEGAAKYDQGLPKMEQRESIGKTVKSREGEKSGSQEESEIPILLPRRRTFQMKGEGRYCRVEKREGKDPGGKGIETLIWKSAATVWCKYQKGGG